MLPRDIRVWLFARSDVFDMFNVRVRVVDFIEPTCEGIST
jgi:hypothetical protein